jgi:hypothetical protein
VTIREARWLIFYWTAISIIVRVACSELGLVEPQLNSLDFFPKIINRSVQVLVKLCSRHYADTTKDAARVAFKRASEGLIADKLTECWTPKREV